MREPWSKSEDRKASPSPRVQGGRGEAGRGDGVRRDLDRWVSAGRQLVDGVSGARPGSRALARAAGRGAAGLPRLNDLGRWVEGKLDWILDDEDDWREPWEEPQPRSRPAPQAAAPSPRRPLEARSRRGGSTGSRDQDTQEPSRDRPAAPPAAAAGADPEGWPDEESFTLPRWQRPPGGRPGAGAADRDRPAPARPAPPGLGDPARPMPRSSRRRPR